MWVSTWRHGCDGPDTKYRETVTVDHPVNRDEMRPICCDCGRPYRLTGWTEVKKAESVKPRARISRRNVDLGQGSLF